MTLLSRPFGRAEGGQGNYFGAETRLGQGIWTRAVELWNERWMNRMCRRGPCYELAGRARQRREVPCPPARCSPPAGAEQQLSLYEAWPLIHEWGSQAMRRALAEEGHVANTPDALERRWPREARAMICDMRRLVRTFLDPRGRLRPGERIPRGIDAYANALASAVCGGYGVPPLPNLELTANTESALMVIGEGALVAGGAAAAGAQAVWRSVPENAQRRGPLTQLRWDRRCESAQECVQTGSNCCLRNCVDEAAARSGRPCRCGSQYSTNRLVRRGIAMPYCEDEALNNRRFNAADARATDLWNQRWIRGAGHRLPRTLAEAHTWIWQWGIESMRRGLAEASGASNTQRSLERAYPGGLAVSMIIQHCARIWDFVVDRNCRDTRDNTPAGRAWVRDTATDFGLSRPHDIEQITDLAGAWSVPRPPTEMARNLSRAVLLGGPGMSGLGGLGENLPGVPSDIALRAKTMVADQTHGGICPDQADLENYITDVLIDAGLDESGLYAPEHVEWVRGQLRMTATMHCKDIWARGGGGTPAPDPVDPEVDPVPPKPRSTSSSTSGILLLGLVAVGAWALWRK